MPINIDPNSINAAVDAITSNASIADAASTLAQSGNANADTLAVMNAMVTVIAIVTNDNPQISYGLGTLGAAIGIASAAQGLSDGDLSLEDAAAIAGVISSLLARNPAWAVPALWFGAFSLAPTLGHAFGQYTPLPNDIRDWVNAALRWQPALRRDPLTLGLDGDGLETVGVSTTNPIMFDHDGDGIKTGTGWVKSDDGFLVMDRNGNGTIDNGTELFGDSTPLSTGGNAINGFTALLHQDSNGDREINNLDTNWANLRVWRDLNQDGISQAGELFTLDQLGIVSLDFDITVNNQLLPDGNRIADLGTYTRDNGSQLVMGEVSQMADIDLSEDPFHREFPDHIPLTESAALLPSLQGSGLVRDLQEAASILNAEGSDLSVKLSAYAVAGTRAEQMALIDGLLFSWGATSEMRTSIEINFDGTEMSVRGENTLYYYYRDDTAIEAFAKSRPDQYKKFTALERFNGRNILANWVPPNFPGTGFFPEVAYSPDQEDFLNQSWQALKESVYLSLLTQTRFKPLMDQIDLIIDPSGIRFDFSQVEQHFQTKITSDTVNGISDLIEFNLATDNLFAGSDWHGFDMMESAIRAQPLTAELELMYADLNVSTFAQTNFSNEGTAKSDIIISGSSADTIHGNAGNDVILAGDGNDRVYGADGNDRLQGGAGDDLLYGENGDDLLEGGAGNDTIFGGTGNNTYLFGKGDGQDLVHVINDITAERQHTLRFKTGVAPSEVVLKQVSDNDMGGNVALELSIAGTTDKITFNGFFYGNDPANGYNSLQEVTFTDGTTWDLNAIKAALFAGSAGADNITGTNIADIINGAAEADVLYGRDGDDTLNGNDGNDILSGENGNDTLDSGAGNDSLYGGLGNNTYLFGRDDGQDLVRVNNVNDTTAGRLNTVQFKAGVTPSEVTLKQVYDNDFTANTALELSIAGTTDKITLNGFFYGDPTNGYNTVQQIKFADGTAWDLNAIKTQLFAGSAGADNITGTSLADIISGAAGADVLYGRDGDDTLNGNDGNDILYGENGNDILDSGAGNDMFYGGYGNNTYLFGRGDGQDLVRVNNVNDTTAGRLNSVQFKAGVAPSEVVLKQVYDNDFTANTALELSIAGTTDKITLNGFFYGDPTNGYNTVQQVKFADGTTWDLNAIKTQLFAGSAGADNITGTSAADIISGAAGADVLYGRDGDDALNGNDGNDILYGENGNDTLEGGAGNDMLYGGYSNNTYLFGKGDGQDVVRVNNVNDTTAGRLNSVQFKAGVVPSEVILKQVYDNDFTANTALELSIAGTTDKITLNGFFYGDPNNGYNTVQQVKFTNGTVWDIPTMLRIFHNVAPIVSTPIAAQTAEEASPFTFVVPTNTFADADLAAGDVLTLSASQADGSALPTWLTFDVSTQTFSGTPPTDAPGNLTVKLTATDTGYASVSTTFQLDILNLIAGTAAAETLNGTANRDALRGYAGNDILDGKAGADLLVGGLGNDTYVIDNAADVVTEIAGEGTDLIQSAATVTLTSYANVENATLTGTSNINATGTASVNVLTGNAGVNILDGGTGADIMIGGAGNDTYLVDSTTDVITEAASAGTDQVQSSATFTLATNVENLTLTGTGNINATGNTSANLLTGNSGNNVLSGGTGIDTMIGGAGNDTYVVDNVADVVTENASEGTDAILSAVTFDLTALTNIENLTLSGAVVANATGNTLANILTGSTGTNTLTGGAGNDTYVIQNTTDVVVENASEGTDVILSSVTYTLSNANVENLTLTGTTAINATGNTTNNVLTGNSGINLLDGGTGADTLIGGAGNDTYVVDNTGDVITEAASAGTDLVQSSVSYTLATNVENLTLTGSNVINATGNTGVNVLTGNSANNILNGGTGADKLLGGLGNDTYVVDNAADVVTENAGEGTDLVLSSVTHTLSANVENLTLSGAVVANATGNVLDNVLTGSTGTNTLTGGAGNDTYVIQNTTDVVAENASEGTDVVQSSVTYTLSNANVENLTLTGAATINGTGNTANNELIGNSGANILLGGDGNDKLSGGTGNDKLFGGKGSDTYRYAAGEGIDTLNNYAATADGADQDTLAITLAGTVDYHQLWFSRADGDSDGTNDDLWVNVIGSADKILVQDWQSNAENQLDKISLVNGNGSTYELTNTQTSSVDANFDRLLQAMATFEASNGMPTIAPSTLDDGQGGNAYTSWLTVVA